VAKSYDSLYSDASWKLIYTVALLKADFDRVLTSIGKGNWQGCTSHKFKDYKGFGKLQRIVIADILGIHDGELQGMGFYQLPQLRGRAYKRMVEVLNGQKVVRTDFRQS